MPAFNPRIRAAVVGIAALTLLAVVGGGAFAASNPPRLYACFDKQGNVRLSDAAKCKLPGGGRLVYWPTAAVPGPKGPTGATGATGPQGLPGARAWAYVLPDGSVGRGAHVTSVTQIETGRYCVHLDGIDPMTTAPIVTVATGLAEVYVAAAAPSYCEPTYSYIGIIVTIRNVSDKNKLVESPFSLLVP
jgi:hypothetical protein